jgi:hypothetical protein
LTIKSRLPRTDFFQDAQKIPSKLKRHSKLSVSFSATRPQWLLTLIFEVVMIEIASMDDSGDIEVATETDLELAGRTQAERNQEPKDGTRQSMTSKQQVLTGSVQG